MGDALTDATREAQAYQIQAIALSLHRQGVASERIYRILMLGDYDLGDDTESIIYNIITITGVVTGCRPSQYIPLTEAKLPQLIALATEMWDSGQDMYELMAVLGDSTLALRAISFATGVEITRNGRDVMQRRGMLW